MKIFKFVAIAVFSLLITACKDQLYTRLSETEANNIVGLLLSAGIDASKAASEENMWMVMVERAEFGRAVNVLREDDFPHEAVSGLGEVFRKEGLVSSPTEERARLIHALSQELSRTLSKIDGVIVARVHVVIAPPDPISERQRPSSVSVFIKHRGDADLARHIPQIKALVLNGIEGSLPDTISVALFTAAPPVRSAVQSPPAKDLPGSWSAIFAALLAGVALTVLAFWGKENFGRARQAARSNFDALG